MLVFDRKPECGIVTDNESIVRLDTGYSVCEPFVEYLYALLIRQALGVHELIIKHDIIGDSLLDAFNLNLIRVPRV